MKCQYCNNEANSFWIVDTSGPININVTSPLVHMHLCSSHGLRDAIGPRTRKFQTEDEYVISQIMES